MRSIFLIVKKTTKSFGNKEGCRCCYCCRQCENSALAGFYNSLLVTSSAATTVASGDYYFLIQRIEGYNVADFNLGTANAKPFTVSFWVRSTTTGTYIAELYDNDNTRQVSQAYTINAANTWEKKALTFPADTTGAFDNDNALSLYAVWWLAAGSTYSSGTLQTSWGNTTANRAVGQTNLLATVGNDFFLTGVQLEVGKFATEFERRPYGQELALCQRYLPAINGAGVIGAGFCGGTTQGFIEVIHFVTPRVAPTGITISAANTFTIYGNSAASVTPTSITLNAGGIIYFLCKDISKGSPLAGVLSSFVPGPLKSLIDGIALSCK